MTKYTKQEQTSDKQAKNKTKQAAITCCAVFIFSVIFTITSSGLSGGSWLGPYWTNMPLNRIIPQKIIDKVDHAEIQKILNDSFYDKTTKLSDADYNNIWQDYKNST